jgi:hypothetical protein
VVIAEAIPAIPAVLLDMNDLRSSIIDNEGSSPSPLPLPLPLPSPMDFVYSIEEYEEALRIPVETGLPWNAYAGNATSASTNTSRNILVFIFVCLISVPMNVVADR